MINLGNEYTKEIESQLQSSQQQTQQQQIPIVPEFDLNDRLQQLENRIWQMMQCNTADEMILKLIECDEIGPAMSSCQQISEDEHKIWRNDIPLSNNNDTVENNKNDGKISANEELKGEDDSEEDFRTLAVMGQYGRSLSKMQSKSFSRELSKQMSSSDFSEKENPPEKTSSAPNLQHGVYIPCQLQIHPFYPNRTPSGLFRLFFVDGVIAAISPNSQWVFYPEVCIFYFTHSLIFNLI